MGGAPFARRGHFKLKVPSLTDKQRGRQYSLLACQPSLRHTASSATSALIRTADLKIIQKRTGVLL